MRYAHSVDQVRVAEEALMRQVAPGALMQRAAAGLAAVCADLLGRVYGARVLILVGSGSNGGDALWAGARLARRGARVEAVLLGSSVHVEGLAAFRQAGGIVATEGWMPGSDGSNDASAVTPREDGPAAVDLVVDGIVGIGGKPGLRPEVAALLDRLSAPVVSVDVPSGIDVDNGECPEPTVRADVTVTFGTHKVGLLVDPGAAAAGTVELVDIGLGPYLGDPVLEVLQAADVRRLLPTPERGSHKYTRGVLGVVAGSEQYTGAGVLVVSAAVQSGLAGMVRYEGASESLVRQAHPEVVVGPGQVQAWVVGSGIGRGLASQVNSVLAERLPTVVDADALRHLPSRCQAPTVLTPHAGELAGMLDLPRAEVEARMVETARAAATQWNAVVLLKGARSVIAAPDGRLRVNPTGVPWLATAGAGDVLSGLIGVLLSAGLDPFDSASVGAWVHGAAATLASSGGPIAAGDVVLALPAAVRGLVLGA
jgi:hydroxyethylthiazole kinase-like uncharacterized protein yjeF